MVFQPYIFEGVAASGPEQTAVSESSLDDRSGDSWAGPSADAPTTNGHRITQIGLRPYFGYRCETHKQMRIRSTRCSAPAAAPERSPAIPVAGTFWRCVVKTRGLLGSERMQYRRIVDELSGAPHASERTSRSAPSSFTLC